MKSIKYMHHKLLNIVVCPICHTRLFINLKESKLICNFDGLDFPIQEDIPVLLIKHQS